MKKIVLITGAGGFIGANLTRALLQKNFEVHTIIRPQSKIWRLSGVIGKIRSHQGDILDSLWLKSALRKIKPDYIFHLAQYGGYPNQNNPEEIWNSNFITTVNLLNGCEEIGFKKFIYTGSSSEYGKKDKPMKESDLLEPNTLYGISKAAATLFCEHKAREKKLPVTIFRLFSIYGPYEEPGRLIPNVLNSYLDQKPIILADKDTARDFVYIDDVIKLFLLSLNDKKSNGQIINVGSGKETTLLEVAKTISKIARKNLPISWSNKVKRVFDTNRWVSDNKKAKKKFSWMAETALKEGMEKTLVWLKQNKHHYDKP